jgi:hypothetical protein
MLATWIGIKPIPAQLNGWSLTTRPGGALPLIEYAYPQEHFLVHQLVPSVYTHCHHHQYLPQESEQCMQLSHQA